MVASLWLSSGLASAEGGGEAVAVRVGCRRAQRCGRRENGLGASACAGAVQWSRVDVQSFARASDTRGADGASVRCSWARVLALVRAIAESTDYKP